MLPVVSDALKPTLPQNGQVQPGNAQTHPLDLGPYVGHPMLRRIRTPTPYPPPCSPTKRREASRSPTRRVGEVSHIAGAFWGWSFWGWSCAILDLACCAGLAFVVAQSMRGSGKAPGDALACPPVRWTWTKR